MYCDERRNNMMQPTVTRFEVWDPFRELTQLHREMDRLFGGAASSASAFPAVNVWSNDNGTIVTAEVPGVDPKAVNIAVTGNLLTIQGERKAESLGEGEIYHRQERGCGAFERTVKLPYEIEEKQVKAHYARGVFRIELPRKESTKPKRIMVEAA
jgi:HSP20 family protein